MTPAATGKREATKHANRSAILDAAREVFADLGFGAATVRDIVRRTDLASGTFYNYFPDKESIFRALVEDFGEEARRRVRDARAAAASPAAFVEDGFRAFFALILEDPELYAFMRRNTGTIRTLFDAEQVPLGAGELAEDLRGAIDGGQLPEIDVDYWAHAMVAVAVEIGERMIERAEPPQTPDVDTATAFCAQLFLRGLGAA